jgi:hypothetical protein
MLRQLRSALITMTRVLPIVGFGRTEDPPTAGVGRSEEVERADRQTPMHEQHHVDVAEGGSGHRHVD